MVEQGDLLPGGSGGGGINAVTVDHGAHPGIGLVDQRVHGPFRRRLIGSVHHIARKIDHGNVLRFEQVIGFGGGLDGDEAAFPVPGAEIAAGVHGQAALQHLAAIIDHLFPQVLQQHGHRSFLQTYILTLYYTAFPVQKQ